jgi:hypothetical protein
LEKIRTSNIVNEVAEIPAAEWIVPEVLNDAASIGVPMRNFELFFGGIWKALEQSRPDRVVPEAINECLVREY